MSNSFKEETFKGKPISELNANEQNQYRRFIQKENKKSYNRRAKSIPQAVIDMKFNHE